MFKHSNENIFANKKLLKVLLHIPYAKTIRELAKLARLPPTTVQTIIAKLRTTGNIKFIPDYQYFGLVNIATIIRPKSPLLSLRPIPGTKAVREFKGIGFKAYVIIALVPHALKQKYIEKLKREIEEKGEIITIVEGKEYLSWKPDEDIMVFLDYNRLALVKDKIFEILDERKHAPKYNPNNKVPDEIDLKILAGKLAWGPYIRPYIIIKRLNTLENKQMLPKQTVSYHYINHVLKGWKYNTYLYYWSTSKVPFTALYLRGPEAPALARALITFPGAHFSFVDTDQAYLFAQFPCQILNDVFDVASAANVEAPLGMMTMKLALKTWSPHLWKFLHKVGQRYEWKWPVEAVVRQRS